MARTRDNFNMARRHTLICRAHELCDDLESMLTAMIAQKKRLRKTT
jgi:hypothetical protein